MTESTTPASPAPSVPQPDHGDRNQLVIRLMLVATFVVFLNETIIGVAIPRLMADLRIEASTAQWLTTAFMLTTAVVIPITGFLMQRLSTRAVFILAMSLFSLGTLIAATAPGFTALLVGRIVQASGTAIMMPLLMTTVMTLVEPEHRGRTMGNISIVMSVAPALGPTISGLILSALDWRWIFILVLPFALGALVLGGLRVQNVTEPVRVPVDVSSVVLSALAFGGLIYGLSSIGQAAAGAAVIAPWLPLTVGALALVAFVARQLLLQRSGRALLDLRTFLTRNFTVSVILMMIAMGALFGTIIILPIYTQDVLGLSPLTTGLLLLPGSLLMGLLGPVIGRLYDRFGPRPLVVPGAIIMSLVLWAMTLLGTDTPVGFVLLGHVTLSLGLALLFTPLFATSMGSLSPALYPHGSATIGTVQQLAGAAGTALFITLMTTGSIALADGGAAEATALAGGMRAAFFAGAVLSVLVVIASFFVTQPTADETVALGAAH